MLNISGLDVLELTYDDSKKFRINADETEALFGVLNVLDIAVVVPTDCFYRGSIKGSSYQLLILNINSHGFLSNVKSRSDNRRLVNTELSMKPR